MGEIGHICLTECMFQLCQHSISEVRVYHVSILWFCVMGRIYGLVLISPSPQVASTWPGPPFRHCTRRRGRRCPPGGRPVRRGPAGVPVFLSNQIWSREQNGTMWQVLVRMKRAIMLTGTQRETRLPPPPLSLAQARFSQTGQGACFKWGQVQANRRGGQTDSTVTTVKDCLYTVLTAFTVTRLSTGLESRFVVLHQHC